jgi:WD40 repeat protein
MLGRERASAQTLEHPVASGDGPDKPALPPVGQEIARLQPGGSCVAFLPHDRLFFVTTGDKVRCFDWSSPKEPKKLWDKSSFLPPPHRDDPPGFKPFDRINHLALETNWGVSDKPRPYHFATGQNDQVVIWQFWDRRIPIFKDKEDAHPAFSLLAPADIVRRPILAVCFVPPHDRYVCGARADKTVYVWDLHTPNRDLRYALAEGGHESAVRALAVSPNGQILASGGDDGRVILWDIDQGKQIRQIDAPAVEKDVRPRVRCLLFRKDKLLVGVEGGRSESLVWLVEVASGKDAGLLRLPDFPHKDPPAPAQLKPGPPSRSIGSLLLHGRYLIGSEQRSRTLPNPLGRRPGVEFLPSAIFVWHMESGKPAGFLPGHQTSIQSMALSPDGRYLLSCDFQDIRLWELNLPR